MSQLERILAALHDHGPMTAREIGAELGMSAGAVNYQIGVFRKYRKGVRIAAFDMSSPTRKERIYALGDAPDAVFDPKYRSPSKVRRVKYPEKTREDIAELHHRERLKKIAAATKPFRDPLLFLTAGVSP